MAVDGQLVSDGMAKRGFVDYGGEVVQCRYEVFPDSETGYQTDNPSFAEFDITEAGRWTGHDLGSLPLDGDVGLFMGN